MSDALEAEFVDLADGILPPAQVRELIENGRNVERLASAAAIAEAGALRA